MKISEGIWKMVKISRRAIVIMVILAFVVIAGQGKKEAIMSTGCQPISNFDTCGEIRASFGGTDTLYALQRTTASCTGTSRIVCVSDVSNQECINSNSAYTNYLTCSGSGGTCTDSDGGDKPLVYGAVTYNSNTYPDFCDSGLLNEQFCTSGVLDGRFVNCATEFDSGWGCSGGKCVQSSTTCSNPTANDGQYTCSNGKIWNCDPANSGAVLGWVYYQDCTSLECQSTGVVQNSYDGLCKEICTNDCTSGQTRCLDASTKQTCGNYDADTCTEWGGNVNCPTGCSGVQCISTNFETIESAVKDGNRIKAHFEIKNTGTTTETFIVEAQVDYQYKKRSVSAIQEVCDISCQNNAYKQVTIIPGATEIFDIILLNNYANLPNGEYFVKAISVNQCCKNGCVDKGPYGQAGKIIGQNIVITSGTQPYDLCPTVYCGDGECSIGEDSASCPTDCNSCTPWVNGACGAGDCWLSGFRPRTRQCTPPNSGETSDCLYDTNCGGGCTSDTDCTAYSGECTIGKCSVAKICYAQDKTDGAVCTNGVCKDGICTQSDCGNSICSASEDSNSCPTDCGSCVTWCGAWSNSTNNCGTRTCDTTKTKGCTTSKSCGGGGTDDWMKYLWIFGGFMVVALMFKVMGSSKK